MDETFLSGEIYQEVEERIKERIKEEIEEVMKNEEKGKSKMGQRWNKERRRSSRTLQRGSAKDQREMKEVKQRELERENLKSKISLF